MINYKYFHVSVIFAGPLGNITWCSMNDLEHLKCTEFAEVVRTSRKFNVDLYCAQAPSKDQCMNFLDNQKVDVVELDPGEMYQGGGYHSVIPILSELYGRGELRCLQMLFFFASQIIRNISPFPCNMICQIISLSPNCRGTAGLLFGGCSPRVYEYL